MLVVTGLPLMPAAGIRCMLCWVPILLIPLLTFVHAEPCARLYVQGLDSTTTFYPQLAGVYKLQTSFFSKIVSASDAD